MENSSKNPILSVNSNKLQAFNFPEIKTEHYLPALDQILEEAKGKLTKIKSNTEKANFKNTIEAMELISPPISRFSSAYYNLLSAVSSDELQALSEKISPKLSAFYSDWTLDGEIFGKVKAVYENQDSEDLNNEQLKLLEETYSDFVRNGANLNDEDKAKLKKIDEELSLLGPKFQENNLKATNKYELIVENAEDVEGLPESAIETAAELAKSKGHDGKWIFTLQYPSYNPFVTYSKNRELRKQITIAARKKSFGDEFDNQDILKKIAVLSKERANLLGEKTAAHYKLKKRMAESPEKVMSFLNEIKTKALPAGRKDVEEVAEYAKKTDGLDKLQPWDLSFYMEKLKKEKFNFDQEELRPYFKLENVIQGAFDHAEKLYDLDFRATTDYPVYHEEVSVYEVYKKSNGDFVGLFYTDFFPRDSKRSGAWMTTYREQGLEGEEVVRPHVSIVCNFSPSTKDKPSLLTQNEVRTLFHEFGHGLHGLLSQCYYQSLAGTNVYWDFVELPSQIMENWAMEKEGLSLFAKHYETGELIPDELIQKVKDSQQFMAGYLNTRQISLGLLDLAYFYNEDPSQIGDVEEFENKAVEEVNLLPTIDGTAMSCSFSHIFGGGYAAGYYSYKWAEVLDADAFEFFKEKGIFNKEVATSFLENVLSKGGTEHPMELYKKFRGREPDTKALLRRDGLI